MRLNIKLSPGSIASAIRRLEEARGNLQEGINNLVDTLVTEGSEVANAAYGGMATAWGRRDREDEGFAQGHIGTSAETMYRAIIAECGAGDAVMAYQFEEPEPVDIYPGSYSEQVGSGEYAQTGAWHFGKTRFTEVQPRHGLLNAKEFIIQNGTEVAEGMIRL